MILRRVQRDFFCWKETTMTDELEQLLRNLKLHRMHAIFDEQLRTADEQQITYSDFVADLAGAVARPPGERARVAHPPRVPAGTLGSGNVSFCQTARCKSKQIRAFAELDFVGKRENLVLIGPTGVGKTGLACGILLKALQNGLRCQFIGAQDLFDEMYASLADRSTRRLVNRLSRLDVLLIDEMGYANLKPEQAMSSSS